jgi:hypothetical protein
MHSRALVLNWQIWGRHRWGLVGALLIVAGICALPQAFPTDKLTSDVALTGIPFVIAGFPFMILILMPFGLVMLYLAYVFSLAERGNRPVLSSFPLWMLTLPVPTLWLVLWPMLSAAVTVALTWLAVGWFALNKVGLEVPLVWPALGMACTLIWIQAVDWSPLGFVSKVLVACAVLGALWTGLMRSETHAVTFAALPAILLLGFVAGSIGVSRLRRGERSSGFALALALRWSKGRARRFTTPQQAQFWLEWRRNGSLLPMLAACWVLLVALVMVSPSVDNGTAMMNATPIFALILAPVAGLILGKPDVWSRQVRLPAFAAGRPLSCGDMFLAKLRMTALSVLAAWLVLALGLAVWLAWGTHFADIWQRWARMPPEQRSAKFYATDAATLIGLFGFNVLLTASTFVVSLTGRFWLVLATLFLYVGGIPTLIAMDALKIFKDYLVEVATVALLLKLLLAGWAFRYCYGHGLISGIGVAGLVAIWLVTVGSAFLAFYLTFLAGRDFDGMEYWSGLQVFTLGPGLLCPLFRIALAPMALAWNRHR